jgi:phosphonate transport system substrate-binding protein
LLASPGDPLPRIDIAWNTNLAFLQADEWSRHGCRPIAMRDTDLAWATKIVAVSGGPVVGLADLRDRTLALGSRDSGHAAILPVHFLAQQGFVEGQDYRTLRFNSDIGKHGDTGTSEAEVVRAVLDGRADAGAIGSPFWQAVHRASGAARRAERNLDVAALQSLHVHRPARFRPGSRAAVRRCAVRDEL